jgi:integrase
MSIRERSGRWYYRFKLLGRQYEATTGLAAIKQNLNAAKTIEAQRRLEAAEGLQRNAGRGLTFQMAAREFLAWCHGTRYREHPNSAKRISGSFSSLIEFFGDDLVAEIAAIDIERYKTHRATIHLVKDCTIRNDLNALSLFLQYAAKAKWRKDNPLLTPETHERVQRPSNEDAVRIHVITPEEENAYFAAVAANPRFRNVGDLAKLILLQGPRPEEVLAAKVGDFDAPAGELKIRGGKTKAARRILYLLGESVEVLARRKRQSRAQGTDWLFPSKHRRGYHIVQLDHTHDSVCQDAGVSFVIYDFRHTFATRQLIEAKIDMASLAAIMGHSNLRVLQKYVHPTADHQRQAMKQYEATRPAAQLKKVKDDLLTGTDY